MKITEQNYKEKFVEVIQNPYYSDETRAEKFIGIIQSLITSIKQEERERKISVDVLEEVDSNNTKWGLCLGSNNPDEDHYIELPKEKAFELKSKLKSYLKTLPCSINEEKFELIKGCLGGKDKQAILDNLRYFDLLTFEEYQSLTEEDGKDQHGK